MQSFRQIGAGILLGIISVVVVLGGLALSLAEGGAADSISTILPTENTLGEIVTSFPTLPLLIFTDTPQSLDFTATASITPPPTLTNCPPPAGWLPILTQSQDTLERLAQTYNTSIDSLRANNCLLSDQLIANSVLYVPPQPTLTPIPCGAPLGWVNYTVIAGDTLYHISLLYRVTVPALRQANCLNSDVIRAGQTLKVPNVPTSTAPVSLTDTPTITVTPTPGITAELTVTPSLTLTPSQPLPSATGTITKTPPAVTETSVMTETPSQTTPPSETPVLSVTETPTP